MRLILTLIFVIVAGAASATSWTDLQTAQKLKAQLERLQVLDALTAPEIVTLSCSATTTNRVVGNVAIKQGDTGRAGVLTALATVVDAKIAAVKAQIEALGVTNVP